MAIRHDSPVNQCTCIPSVRLLLYIAMHTLSNSMKIKAKNNKLEVRQYPAIQRNLTKYTIDCGA
jgi:hypothetical protein